MTMTTSLTSPFTRVSLLTLALGLGGAAACEDNSTSPPNTPVESGLQQVLDQAVAKPGVLLPGAITYYRDTAYAPWSSSAGLADMTARTPMRPQDRVRAGSILKTFVATVVLQHVEEGTLSLDQTLTALLPPSVTDRVANADRITLHMLLNHTSGIPEWETEDVDLVVMREPARIWTDDEAIDLAAIHPALFPPGTAWGYSNTNYTLAGMVLDRVGGSSWRQQIRSRIVSRLGLASTQLPEPGDVAIAAPFARGYHDVDGTPVDTTQVDPSMAGAAGGHGLITSAQDLARFLDALLAGKLFARPETLTAMTTMVDAPSEAGLPHRYGLGLESYELDGTTVIGNSGSAAGYASMMFKVQGKETILVTSINTNSLFTNALEVFMPSLKVITGAADQAK
jgi:D-alanyl-D-alanine carboxypeptidase